MSFILFLVVLQLFKTVLYVNASNPKVAVIKTKVKDITTTSVKFLLKFSKKNENMSGQNILKIKNTNKTSDTK